MASTFPRPACHDSWWHGKFPLVGKTETKGTRRSCDAAVLSGPGFMAKGVGAVRPQEGVLARHRMGSSTDVRQGEWPVSVSVLRPWALR